MIPLSKPHVLFLLLLAALSSEVYAQAAHTAMTFQTINTAPRNWALGEAPVALRGYAGAAQFNPATIGRQAAVQLGTTFDTNGGLALRTPWITAFTDGVWIAAPSLDVRYRRWGLAYQYREISLGRHEYRDAQNNLLGTYRSYDHSHKLALAYDLSPRLSVGAAVNLIDSHFGAIFVGGELDRGDADALSLDLGLAYEHPFVAAGLEIRPAAGWSLTDFGRRVRYPEVESPQPVSVPQAALPLPTVMRGGLSVELAPVGTVLGRPLVTAGFHGALSKDIVRVERETSDDGFLSFEAHGPFRALFTSWKPLPLDAWGGEEVTLGVREQLRRHRGVELSVMRILYARWGRFSEHELLGARRYATRGWGLDLYYIALDHARIVTPHFGLGGTTFWTFTARVPLRESPDNFWLALRSALREAGGR